MNRSLWRRTRRAALVVSCVAYFATLAVIGQVAEGDRFPAVAVDADLRPR